MKKLIGFLLALALGASAFGQLRLENLFQNRNLGSITPESYDRVLYFDNSGSRSANTKVGYLTWSNFIAGVDDALKTAYLQTGRITVDTNTVVADAAAATDYISLSSGDLLHVLGAYIEAGWADGDFVEFNNADSNATTLDTLNIGPGTLSATFHTNDWYFYATQDCTIYINLGDTVSVADGVEAIIIYTINR